MQRSRFNMRRPQFQDPRVRQAFNLAFDFEWANKNLFYDQYAAPRELLRQLGPEGDRPAARPRARDPRTSEGQGAARGIHHGMEEPGQSPRPEDARKHCAGGQAARGSRLDAEERSARRMPRASSSTAEFLLVQPDFERIVLPSRAALEKLGIKASVRIDRHLAVSAPPRYLRLRHHRRQLSRNRCRPATSSATSGARRPPARKAAATSSASRTPQSTS